MDEFEELRRALREPGNPAPPPPPPRPAAGMSEWNRPARNRQEPRKASAFGWNLSKRSKWVGMGILGVVLLLILVTNAQYSVRMREATVTQDAAVESPVSKAGQALIDEVNQSAARTPAERRKARKEREERIRQLREDVDLQTARTRCRHIWDTTATKPIAELTPSQAQMIDLCQAAGLYPPPGGTP